MPLMWAHAEYVKLLRSVSDGQVFDLIPVVAERYLKKRGRKNLEVLLPSTTRAGHLDILVNTVGGYVGGVALWELDTKELRPDVGVEFSFRVRSIAGSGHTDARAGECQ